MKTTQSKQPDTLVESSSNPVAALELSVQQLHSQNENLNIISSDSDEQKNKGKKKKKKQVCDSLFKIQQCFDQGISARPRVGSPESKERTAKVPLSSGGSAVLLRSSAQEVLEAELKFSKQSSAFKSDSRAVRSPKRQLSTTEGKDGTVGVGDLTNRKQKGIKAIQGNRVLTVSDGKAFKKAALPTVAKFEQPEPLMPQKVVPHKFETEVEVTHIENPGLFYIQRGVDRQNLERLFRKVNGVAATASAVPESEVAEGEVYLGQYSMDGNWYRASIKSMEENGSEALVEYIDYGNTELVKTDKLAQCPEDLQLDVVPRFSLSCALWEIRPARGDVWDSEATKLFTELVIGKYVQMLIISVDSANDGPSMCQVDLRRPIQLGGISNDLPLSIREILIFMELAVYIHESPESEYQKECSRMWQRSYFSPEIPFGVDDTPVQLLQFDSLDRFFLQLKVFSEHFSDLMNLIQRHYFSQAAYAETDWKIYLPRIGMPCAALSEETKLWQRAVIADIPGNKMVEVHYVDTGKDELLSYTEIRKMPDTFMSIVSQAIECRLHGVMYPKGSDETWSPEVKNILMALIEEHEDDMQAVFHSIKDRVCSVSLFFVGEDIIDFAQHLISTGYASPVPVRFGTHSKPHARKNEAQSFHVNMRSFRNTKPARGFKIAAAMTEAPRNENKCQDDTQSVNKTSPAQRKKQPLSHISVDFLEFTSPSQIHVRLTSQRSSFYRIILDKTRNGRQKRSNHLTSSCRNL